VKPGTFVCGEVSREVRYELNQVGGGVIYADRVSAFDMILQAGQDAIIRTPGGEEIPVWVGSQSLDLMSTAPTAVVSFRRRSTI